MSWGGKKVRERKEKERGKDRNHTKDFKAMISLVSQVLRKTLSRGLSASNLLGRGKDTHIGWSSGTEREGKANR